MYMRNIYKALLIGLAAGTIDALPMIFQGLPWSATISAFVHWIVLGLIIPYVNWNIKPWLKGFIIALLSELPIIIIVAEKEPISIIPITAFSVILGVSVGYCGDRFIKV